MFSYSLFVDENNNFLISGTPTIETLTNYLKILKEHNINHVIRVCIEKTYPKYMLEENGIIFFDMPIVDGSIPSEIDKKLWLDTFLDLRKNNINRIAVHCVSGHGRASLYVALCLLYDNYNPYDAITKIREVRTGSFNSLQIKYIKEQKNKSKSNCCIIL